MDALGAVPAEAWLKDGLEALWLESVQGRLPLGPEGEPREQAGSTVGAGCVVEREEARARRPRLDWATLQRRTFEADVWQCPCGGRRRVVAVVSDRRTAEEVLRNMGLSPRPARKTPRPGHSPPQLRLVV